MISKSEAARRGLLKHPSGFYVDTARYCALPDGNCSSKIRPADGEIALAFSNEGWFIGWTVTSISNTLCCVRSTSEPKFKKQPASQPDPSNVLNWFGWGFVDHKPEKATVVPMAALVSPSRLALERHRQRLDGILL